MRSLTVLTTLLLTSLTSAHYQLTYPKSLGFDEDTEINAPCGGSEIKFANNDTEVPVDGFPIALLTTHATGNFSYRATLSKQAPFQWVELLAVSERGLGNFCLPNLRAPANWTGQSGLVQVIGDLGDGTLYQCAAVRFVSGSTTTLDTTTCRNGTVSAVVTSTGNATGTTTSNASTTGTSATSATPSRAAADNLVGSAFVAGLGAAFVGLAAL